MAATAGSWLPGATASAAFGVALGLAATWVYCSNGQPLPRPAAGPARGPVRAGTAAVPRPRAARRAPSARAAAAKAAGAGADVCPPDMALVDGAFCPALRYRCLSHVGRSKYQCAEYASGQRCLAASDHRRFCIDRYEWPNRAGELPLVYVSWDEAAQHCRSVSKRLCRRSEWVLACEGPKRLPYPWGFVRQPSPCNIDRSSVPFDAAALERAASREQELARLWQADRIGSHPDCVSAYGVYDLSGNVDEWTDNAADNPGTEKPTTLNGGYWGPVRNTCRLTTKSHGRRFRFYQVGFRCCRDARDGESVPPPKPWIEGDEMADAPSSAGSPYDDVEDEP